jgi:CubicO group peptidase (beta-lactamase class C family)
MHALSRRTAMRLLAGVSAMPSLVAAAPIADLADRLDTGIRSGALRDVHAVLISRGGHVVLERYYAGADESWGRPLGMVSFGPDTLHDLRSVTKSVVGLLYGIALDRGLVPQPEAPLLEQFPEYPDLPRIRNARASPSRMR